MLVTHIYYNGQCKKAIEMYREAFGATIKTMIEDSNTQLIAHAELIIHNELLMMNDFGNNDGFSKSGAENMILMTDAVILGKTQAQDEITHTGLGFQEYIKRNF